MQIGIDLGATKIEYVLLDNNNKEVVRNRIPTPDNYDNTLLSIIKIVKNLEKNDHDIEEQIRSIRSKTVYNIGYSATVGAKYIQQLMESNYSE